MDAILQNPYRIVGLLVGASAKEQAKQINKLKKYIEAEQDPQDDFSFPALGKLHRTIEDVEEAATKLNLDNDKISVALFWFWNGNPVTDEAAFEALKRGDIKTANEIWVKLITKTDKDGKRLWKPVTEKNYSAFHNFSILNIIQSNGNFHNAIVAGIYFLENDLVYKFISSVVDETFKISKKQLQLLFLNQLYSEIETNKKTSLPEFLAIINKLEFLVKQDFIKSLVQKLIEHIEHKIEIAKDKRKSNKANGAVAGQELFNATANDLDKLKSIVGSNDLKYTSIADKVANEILQCSIDYFNDIQEKGNGSDALNIAMKLAKQAESIAVGKLIRGRISENIAILEEIKDQELLQAIAVLQSIKYAYEEACWQIDMQVDELRYYTFGTTRIPKSDVSINWKKVEEMKRNCLDWNKVVEVIREAIPPQNIDKIKRSSNTNKLNEYKILVDFLMRKIRYPYKFEIEYIKYWETSKTISSTTTSERIIRASSTQSSFKFASNAWWILGIVGIIIGLFAGLGSGCIITGLIGVVIGSRFSD